MTETLTHFFSDMVKVVYTYQSIDSWQIFNGTPLSHKKKIYSNLTMKDITDADYKNTGKKSVRISE